MVDENRSQARRGHANLNHKVTGTGHLPVQLDIFPFIGSMPISTIGPQDLLDRAVRKIEARGAIDTAHRAMQICVRSFVMRLRLSPHNAM